MECRYLFFDVRCVPVLMETLVGTLILLVTCPAPHSFPARRPIARCRRRLHLRPQTASSHAAILDP